MERGTVAWFDDLKGFGFISRENGADIFVHYNQIISDINRKTLKQGDVVQFDLSQTSQGVQACGVRIESEQER